MNLNRQEWETAARRIWEDAYKVDASFTEQVTREVTGGDVFVWGNLTTRQIRALHRGLFATARLTVGVG